MEVVKIKGDEKSALIEVREETFTLTSAIEEQLWEDKNVSEAASFREHPYLSEPKIWIKVERGSVKEALEKAAEDLIETTKEFREKFKKAI
jgi:DNA-directed RNA polymerase subunit L